MARLYRDKSYEERYKQIMKDLGANSKLTSNPNDYEARYLDIKNSMFDDQGNMKSFLTQDYFDEQKRQSGGDTGYVPVSDFNKSQTQQTIQTQDEPKKRNALQAVGGSLAQGVVNTVRQAGSLGERIMTDLSGSKIGGSAVDAFQSRMDDDIQDLKILQKQGLGAFFKARLDGDFLKNTAKGISTASPIGAYATVGRAALDTGETASNKVLKPIEDKIKKWADVEDEAYFTKIVSGAVQSMPQTLLTKTSPFIGVPLIFNNAFQNSMEQYAEEGLDINDEKVRTRGIASAMVETGSEYIFGAFKGLNTGFQAAKGAAGAGVKGALMQGGKGFLDGFLEKSAKEVIKPTWFEFVKHIAIEGAKEGLEEVFSEIGQGIVAILTTEKGKPLINSWREQYETDPTKGTPRYDGQGNPILDEKTGQPIMFDENDEAIMSSGVITGGGIFDAFLTGAVAAGVMTGLSSAPHFISTRKFLKDELGAKNISKISQEDVNKVFDNIREDAKNSPQIKEEMAKIIDDTFINAVALDFEGTEFLQPTTGDRLTASIDLKNEQVTLNSSITGDAITMSVEQFDSKIDEGFFSKMSDLQEQETQQTGQSPMTASMQSAPQDAQTMANAPETMPVGQGTAVQGQTEVNALPNAQTASQGVQGVSGGIAVNPVVTSAFGKDSRSYVANLTNDAGEQAKINATVDPKKGTVAIKIDTPDVKNGSLTIDVPASDYLEAGNKAAYLNDESGGKLSRAFRSFGNSLLYDAVTQTASTAIDQENNIFMESQKSEQPQSSQEQGKTATADIERTTTEQQVNTNKNVKNERSNTAQTSETEDNANIDKIQSELSDETKGKSSADIKQSVVDRFKKRREIVREIQSKYISEDVMKAMRSVDEDFDKYGIVGWMNPIQEADLTRKQKNIRTLLEKETGKTIVFMESVGSADANEFVSDFTKDTVFVNTSNRTQKDILWAVGHGLWHLFKKDGRGEIFEKAVTEYITPEEIENYIESDRFAGMDEYKAHLRESDSGLEEIVADKAGDVLTSARFWADLAKTAPTADRGKMINSVAKFLERIKSYAFASTKEVNSMIKVFDEIRNTETKPSKTLSQIEYSSGNEVKTKIVPNKYINLKPTLISANDLVPSNDANGDPIDGYNNKYQPRGRDRASSILQIKEIISNPDFEEMVRTGDVSSGMTTFNPKDMNVLSGNGRVAAIQGIYNQGGNKAEGLHSAMIKMAERLGINTDNVPANPIVSGAIPEGTDPVVFAQESNPSVGLQYSPSENAKLDSRKLTPDIISLYNDSDLNNRSNHSFVSNFLNQFAKEELASFQDENGYLSQVGKQRISNAILYKAFPSDRLINLIAESTDSSVKNTTNALMNVSGLIVSVRDQIEKGNYHDLDISKEITSAFEKYIEISKTPKLKGYDSAIDAYFSQVTMDFMNMSPIEEKIIKVFYGFRLSRPSLVGFLSDYYNNITKLSRPDEVSLFGDNFAPDRDAYIDNAFLKVLGEAGKIYENESGTPENPNNISIDEFLRGSEKTDQTTRDDQGEKSETEEVTTLSVRDRHQKDYQSGNFKYYAMVKLDGENGYHVMTTKDSDSKQEFREDLLGNGYAIMNNVIGDKADYHMVNESGKYRTVNSAKKALTDLRKTQRESDNPKIWDSEISDLEDLISEANSKLESNTKFSLNSDVTKRAVELYGTTFNKYEAGYILPDGRMLDFSGKKEGAQPSQRSMDHREVGELYDTKFDTASEGMMKFVEDTGAVRVDFGKYHVGIDIIAKSTISEKQKEIIRKHTARVETVNIDVYGGYYKTFPIETFELDMPRIADINNVLGQIELIMSKEAERNNIADRVLEMWQEDYDNAIEGNDLDIAKDSAVETAESFINVKRTLSGNNLFSLRSGIRRDTTSTKLSPSVHGGIRNLFAPMYGFKRNWRNLDFVGLSANTKEEIAAAAMIARDPKIEHSNIYYVKDGKIILHEGWTSNLPSAATALPYRTRGTYFYSEREQDYKDYVMPQMQKQANRVGQRMDKLNADGIYISHNHPSGDPKPSIMDIGVAKTLKGTYGNRFLGEITVDHNRAVMIEIDEYKNESTTDIEIKEGMAGYTSHDLFSHNNLPDVTKGGTRSFNAETIVEAVSTTIPREKISNDHTTLVYLDAKARIIGIQTIPNGMIDSKDFRDTKGDHLVGFINNQKTLFGGTQVFAVSNRWEKDFNVGNINKAINSGVLTDYIVLTDGDTVTGKKPVVKTSARMRGTFLYNPEIGKRGIESVMVYEEQIKPQMPNRPIPFNSKRIPEDGHYPAIETDDGQIFWSEDGDIHVKIAKDMEIPAEHIRSGGWLTNGVYEPTDQSSIMSWANIEKAKQRVSYNRYIKQLENNSNIKYSMRGEHAWSKKNLNSEYYEKPVLDLVDDAMLFYNIKTNQESLERATKMLRSNESEALGQARDTKIASSELTIIRMTMTFRAQMTGDFEEAANWVYIVNDAAKNAAQAVQAHSMFQKLDPQSILAFASRQMARYRKPEDQKELENKTNGVKNQMRLADLKALEDLFNDDTAIIKALKRDNTSLKRRLDAAKKLEDRINQNKQFISEFDADPIKDFIEIIHGVTTTVMPVEDMPKTQDPVVFMRWVVKNGDKMSEVWERALRINDLTNETGTMGKAEVMAYMGDLMPESVRSEMPSTDLNQDVINQIMKVIRTEYRSDYRTFNSMVKRLLEIGVTERDAITLTRHINVEINRLSREEKIRTLRKILPNPNSSQAQIFIDKIVNITNEKGLSDAEVQGYLAHMMKIPALTPDLMRELTDLSQRIADINQTAAIEGRKLNQDEQRQVDIMTATILARISAKKPVHWTQKVDLVQSMMMLSMFKSAERNIIGNTLFMTVDTMSDFLIALSDRAISIATGTKPSIPFPQFKAMVKGAVRGAKESYYDIMHGIDTSELDVGYSIQRGQVFSSKGGQAAMKLFRLKMALPDRIAQAAAYESALSGLMKMHGIKNREDVTQDMKDYALYNAQRKTFTDDNVISRSFSQIRRIGNNFYNPKFDRKGGNTDSDYGWGLGSMLVKFPRVPGALLVRSVEYSPISLVKALFTLVKPAFEAKKHRGTYKQRFGEHHQVKFATQLVHGTFGSMISIGLGYVLSRLGLLLGRREEDKKKRDMLEIMGIRGNQLNWTGLMRFLTSGGDESEAEMRAGDALTSYEWLSPMSLGIAMGANFYHETKSLRGADIDKFDKFMQIAMVSAASGLETITEMSLMRGIADFTNSSGYRTNIEGTDREQSYFLEKVINVAISVPATFIPNALKVTKEMNDNVKYSTYSTDFVTYATRLAMNKVPKLAQKLPPQVDMFGNLKEVYQDNGNNVWNVFFNPAWVNKYTPSPEAVLVLNTMAEKEGTDVESKNVTPNRVSTKIPLTLNGEKTELILNDYEREEMQQIVGKTAETYFKQIDPNLPIEEKVRLMNEILSETSKQAKEYMAKKKLGIE